MTERYRLHLRDAVLDDLRERLARTRWPDEIPYSGWQFGANPDFMRRLTAYWRDESDWRTQEAKLNAFDQYRAQLDDIDLHFIHQPGVGPDPIPLLLVHAWPGSVWEFHEIVPRLTDPARFGGEASRSPSGRISDASDRRDDRPAQPDSQPGSPRSCTSGLITTATFKTPSTSTGCSPTSRSIAPASRRRVTASDLSA